MGTERSWNIIPCARILSSNLGHGGSYQMRGQGGRQGTAGSTPAGFDTSFGLPTHAGPVLSMSTELTRKLRETQQETKGTRQETTRGGLETTRDPTTSGGGIGGTHSRACAPPSRTAVAMMTSPPSAIRSRHEIASRATCPHPAQGRSASPTKVKVRSGPTCTTSRLRRMHSPPSQSRPPRVTRLPLACVACTHRLIRH